MFIQKNNIFLELSKNQKASIIAFLRNFTKKNSSLSDEEILNLFIEDEAYYFEVGNPHFEWIIPLFDNESFLREVKYLIKSYKQQIVQKELQRPYIEKQKAYMKEQRKKMQEMKLSKESPTDKQLKYYNSLCKKYNLEKVETKNLSKLDLKNMISKILLENPTDTKFSSKLIKSENNKLCDEHMVLFDTGFDNR